MVEEKPIGLDLQTPINASLTAFYQRSFAYQTVKFRLPATLSQTINIMIKKKFDILKTYGEDAEEDIKTILNEIGKLKLELLQNKPLRKLVGDAPDIALYNKYLDICSSKITSPSYYNITWLFCECYMYRRIREAIEQSKLLKELDPFQLQKEDAYYRTVQVMALMGSHLLIIKDSSEDTKEQDFMKLMELNLWSNKCDLSLKLSRMMADSEQLLNVEDLRPNILCNDLPRIWEALTDDTSSHTIDIILDNVGYELFADMCLADFFVTNGYARHVRFYTKAIPWFISDVMTKDFNWTISQLRISRNPTLKNLGDCWSMYMNSKAWTVEEHNYWTLPFLFKDMAKWDKELYTKLSKAKLIVFKGDVTYRKLLGERNWLPTAPFAEVLEGFHPSKLFVVRTLKSSIICGLDAGVAEKAEAIDKDWLLTGKYGVIHFCDAIVRI